jgi:hypothetical protein
MLVPAIEVVPHVNTDSEQDVEQYTTVEQYTIMEDQIERFTSLNDNERFAFFLSSVQDAERRSRWEMTLYAVNADDTENFSELFTRRSVHWVDIQLANDYRKVFFREAHFVGNAINSPQIHNLYVADGYTGEIRRVLSDMNVNSWRVSNDGRFISFIRPAPSTCHYTNIYLFDVENEVIIGEFKWRPNQPEGDMICMWRILRHDNVFRILGLIEFYTIHAVAELNPATMELETLWDTLEMSGLPSLPVIRVHGFVDDVDLQHANIRSRN